MSRLTHPGGTGLHALPEDREQCFRAGMNEHSAKPVHCERVAAVLERLGSAASPAHDTPVISDAGYEKFRRDYGEDGAREIVDSLRQAGRGHRAIAGHCEALPDAGRTARLAPLAFFCGSGDHSSSGACSASPPISTCPAAAS